MKQVFSDFQIYKRECGFLFLFSMIYSMAYLIFSSQITQPLVLNLFLAVISVLFSVGWYHICLKIWGLSHKIHFREGIQIMGFQILWLVLTSFVFRKLLSVTVSATIPAMMIQACCGLLFFTYPFVQMTYFYHVATKEKMHWKWKNLRNGIVLMLILVGIDTALNGVFSLSSVNFWSLLSNLMYEGHPWFNWIMVLTIGIMFQASSGMMFLSLIVYFFVGLFYAIIETNYVASVKRVNCHGT